MSSINHLFEVHLQTDTVDTYMDNAMFQGNDNPISIDKAITQYQDRDLAHWRNLELIIKQQELPLSEVLVNYPAFIRRRELPRLLADYELFKMIVDLPGSIVELGVYLGSGMFTWAKLLETFVPGDRSRKVYGFDNCTGYPQYAVEDGNPEPWVSKMIGEKQVTQEFLENLNTLHNNDNLIPGLERSKLVIGPIEITVPNFVKTSQGTRLSLLYFDVNLYQPTWIGLENFYSMVMPGGVIAFNGYGSPPWQGEAIAIEQYFLKNGLKQPKFKKFPFSNHPSAYFIKE